MSMRNLFAAAVISIAGSAAHASTMAFTEADFGGDYGDFTPLDFGTITTLTTFSGSVTSGNAIVSDYVDRISITLLGDAEISWSRTGGPSFSVYEGDPADLSFTSIFDQPVTFGPGSYVLEVVGSFELGGDYTLTVDPVAIPLPAAGWLLLAGLGGLTALRLRR